MLFLSTLSLRRATLKKLFLVFIWLFLSTLSLRRATARRDSRQQPAGISIHALLAESDRTKMLTGCAYTYFYPRSPCGERPCITTITICTVSFLSTLSLRRATFSVFASSFSIFYFYPRSPCGERHRFITSRQLPAPFLSTLSLRRATVLALCSCGGACDFYPRSPCGERPCIVGAS